MRVLALLAVALSSVLVAALGSPVRAENGAKKIDAAVQAKLDEWKKTITAWAADPIVLKQVIEQNEKGPIAEMTEEKWKVLKPRSPEVKAFENNPAGELLRAKAAATGGVVSEAFLNGAKGEKVAFTDKTSSYIHKGKAKFDRPFESRQPWQGEPEFDESTQTDSVQLAVPVLLKEKDGDAETVRSIGVLVVGIDLSKL